MAWKLLARGDEVGTVADELAQHFGVSSERALCDIRQLLQVMGASARDSFLDEREGAPGALDDAIASGCRTSGETLDHGTFHLGSRCIRFLTSSAAIEKLYFRRFAHRAVSGAVADHLVEIAEAGPSCRLILDGTVVDEVPASAARARLIDFLLEREHAGQPLMARCHAAAVVREGRSILMPGDSGVGKSTLTAHLVATGMAYLGDDVVALGEEDASLFPLPSCLSIKAGSWQLVERHYPGLMQRPSYRLYERDVRYLEPPGHYTTLPSGPPPAAIVFPAFVPGAVTRLEALSPLAAMVRFVGAHTCLMGPVAEDKLLRLIRFVERTPAYELSYSQLPEAERAIAGLLAT